MKDFLRSIWTWLRSLVTGPSEFQYRITVEPVGELSAQETARRLFLDPPPLRLAAVEGWVDDTSVSETRARELLLSALHEPGLGLRLEDADAVLWSAKGGPTAVEDPEALGDEEITQIIYKGHVPFPES